MADQSDSSYADPLGSAANRLRDTTKWLIASLAAIGATLVAGSQLSSIGTLSVSDGRFWAAAAGAVVALTGVGFAIWEAAQTLTPVEFTLGILAAPKSPKTEEQAIASFVEGMPEIFEGFVGSLHELQHEYRLSLENRRTALDLNAASPQDKSLEDAATAAVIRARTLSNVVQNVLSVATWERVRRRFERALPRMFISVGIAAAGIMVFAWAANPPKP